MTEHLHYITHTHDTGYGIKTRFTCTGDRTSPCHQYPPDDAKMETWGEDDRDVFVAGRDVFVAHDDCWLESWMEDAGCAETCGPDGDPVRSGPITVTWNGDCVEWEYAKGATALTERPYTLADMARAWDEGYRARGADAIYTGLTGCPSDTPNPYEQEEA